MLMIYGCGSGSEEDTRIIKDIIQKYDQQLAEGYMKMDMSLLKGMITPDYGYKLEHRLEAFKIAQRRMETELKNTEFVEINFVSGKRTKSEIARVRTREIWDTRHIDLKTEKTIKKIKGLTYVLSYELIKIEGKWLINSVAVLEEKIPRKE